MPSFESERALLRAIRDNLDGWIYDARREAFADLFEGDDALLTEDELRVLDRLDSRLSREQGQGLWGADEYGIVQTGALDDTDTPRVVCTNHPEIPETVYPGDAAPNAELAAKLDDALWKYCQQVVERTQQQLEEFVWAADIE